MHAAGVGSNQLFDALAAWESILKDTSLSGHRPANLAHRKDSKLKDRTPSGKITTLSGEAVLCECKGPAFDYRSLYPAMEAVLCRGRHGPPVFVPPYPMP